MNGLIIDCFAGMGGWSEGLRLLGLFDVGLEIDPTACRTRIAAGHHTIRCDVSAIDPSSFCGVTGLVLSPPCTDFSIAGLQRGMDGETGHLITEVMRWARALRPEWIACEQVPPCLPIWREYASELRAMGYDTWAGLLNSANLGVPQTRARAILMASRVRSFNPPLPTHAEVPGVTLFGERLLPWVSMAEALGWVIDGDCLVFTRNYRRSRGGNAFSPERPSWALGKATRTWVVRTGTNTMKHSRRNEDMVPYERSVLEPAPTLDGKAGHAWKVIPHAQRVGNQEHATVRDIDKPAPTLYFGHALNDVRWVFDRPATTLVGSFCPDVVAGPGHHEGSRQNAPGSVKITVGEALILQGFRPDYLVQGSRTVAFTQIGNAFPSPVAAAIIGELTGIDWHRALWGQPRERVA